MILLLHQYFTETEKNPLIPLLTGFQQKLFRLKICPQGVLETQEEKFGFWIFTT